MNDEQVTKRRSYRRVPRYSLAECVDALRLAVVNVGDSPVDGTTLAEALGYSSRSGTSDAKIGSLTHFGFFVSGGGEYALTDLARRILYPVDESDSKHALVEAVKQPTVFRELFEAYSGSRLPELLKNILVQKHGVNPNTSGDVAETFLESVRYAELLDGRNLLERLTEREEVAAEPIESDSLDSIPTSRYPDSAINSKSVGVAVPNPGYAIPLSGGRSAVLSLPTPMTSEDIKRINGWLTLMAPVLMEGSEDASAG